MTTTKSRSETLAWDDVEGFGSSLLGSREKWVQEIGRELMALSVEMRDQVAKGIHRNPPIVLYGNPPAGRRYVTPYPGQMSATLLARVSERVYELRYRHIENGKDYRHQFAAGVELDVIDRDGVRDLLLTHQEGKPLGAEF